MSLLTNDFCRNGWGASAVDAFTTAIVMQIPEIVTEILNYIPTINFDVSIDDEQVSLFETTIRYLGGMISGKSDTVSQDAGQC